jgi:hypothetical protein
MPCARDGFIQIVYAWQRIATGRTCARQLPHGGLLDRFNQLAGREGLAKAGHAAGCKGLPPNGLVFQRCHEDHRNSGVRSLKVLLQLNAGHTSEMNVQEEIVGLGHKFARKEFLGGRKGRGQKSVRVQQIFGSPKHAWIVINDGHDFAASLHKYLMAIGPSQTGSESHLHIHCTVTERMPERTCPFGRPVKWT